MHGCITARYAGVGGVGGIRFRAADQWSKDIFHHHVV